MFTLLNLSLCHTWLIHVTVEQIQSRVCMSPCSVQTAAELLLFYCVFFWGAEEFPKLFSGLVFRLVGTRDADPAGEFGALFEEERNLATTFCCRSILSRDANQNSVDLLPMHTRIMRSHCVLNKKMTCLRCSCYTLNIRIGCAL